MKRFTFLLSALVLLTTSFTARAQSDVDAIFAEVGLTQDDLNHIADGTKAMEKYAYTLRSVEDNGSDYKHERVMKYDPRKQVGERWTLISVNGNDPTEDNIKAFNKEKNDPDDHIKEQHEDLVDQTWIESNTDSELVVGYQFNKKHLHHSQKMLKHLKARVVIDKAEKDIESVELYNFEPFKMLLLFKVSELKVQIDFQKLNDTDELISTKNTTMKLAMSGEETVTIITETYSDYEKVL